MTEALEQVPDADLIAAVRAGDVPAFAVLYERHLIAAKRAAACLANTPAEREDLVAEAFTRVLRMLREGRGPAEEFRPYLLVTLRNTAIHNSTRRAPVSLCADVPEVAPAAGADGPVIDRWHASVAADAFASLPERWRVVLWHTEVENESPATVAPLLGMRPNSVAALAYRAREGLRQAYLRMQVPQPPRPECRPTVEKLAGYVRHSIPLPLSRKIGKHLADCADCRARADALASVNSELRGMVGPVVLGAPLAAAYLSPAATGTGALSGLLAGATSAVSSAVSSALSTAYDTVSTVASGLFAAKAVAAQAVVAVTATAVTVSSSAPAEPRPPDGVVVAATAESTRPAVSTGTSSDPGVRPARRPAPVTRPATTAAATTPTAAAATTTTASAQPSTETTEAAATGTAAQQPAEPKKDKKAKNPKAKKDKKVKEPKPKKDKKSEDKK